VDIRCPRHLNALAAWRRHGWVLGEAEVRRPLRPLWRAF
jgi:hypothetical protein